MVSGYYIEIEVKALASQQCGVGSILIVFKMFIIKCGLSLLLIDPSTDSDTILVGGQTRQMLQ